jgi:hypothetical protein
VRYSKSFCRVYLKAHASAVMARSSCSRAANICTKSTCPVYPCQTENQNCNMQTQMHRCDLNSVSHLEIGTCDCKTPPNIILNAVPSLCQTCAEAWLKETMAGSHVCTCGVLPSCIRSYLLKLSWRCRICIQLPIQQLSKNKRTGAICRLFNVLILPTMLWS